MPTDTTQTSMTESTSSMASNIPITDIPGVDVYSFAVPPESYIPSGTVNLTRLYTFDVTLSIFDVETNKITTTTMGTIQLTPDEYTWALTTDPRTGEKYVSE